MKWSKERLDKTEQQYLQLKEEIPELRQAVYALSLIHISEPTRP